MPKTEKTLEKRRFMCPCGETIVYDNPCRGVQAVCEGIQI